MLLENGKSILLTVNKSLTKLWSHLRFRCIIIQKRQFLRILKCAYKYTLKKINKIIKARKPNSVTSINVKGKQLFFN